MNTELRHATAIITHSVTHIIITPLLDTGQQPPRLLGRLSRVCDHTVHALEMYCVFRVLTFIEIVQLLKGVEAWFFNFQN